MRKIFFLVALLFSENIFSQDTLLTLQKAIEISLEKNYSIRIAKNVAEQQENNNTAGNAGMLPNIDANGVYSKSSNTINQKYNTGVEVERDAATTTVTGYDVTADWTIFNGLRMFYTKEKLGEFSMQSQDQLKIQIEDAIQLLIAAYYTVVREIQLLKALREELKLSEERMKIADRKLSNGSGSRLEWLSAKTEFNRQRSQEIFLLSEADAAKLRLNQLLARDLETKFSVIDTVIITYKPVFDDLKKSVPEKNNVLNFYKRDQNISRLSLKETKALRWPEIHLNSRYAYTKTNNEAGLILLNQSQGFIYGVTATIPLFHGFDINRQAKNSRLDVINSDIQFERFTMEINVELYNAWREFNDNLALLKIEEENIGFAREVFTIAMERYRIGVSNAVEQQDAQRTFEEAMIRLADARYNAVISEAKLRKLNGELVK